MIKISIITATFNSSGTILSTIESINSQTYQREFIEHVLIDGVSTDGTREIIHAHLMNGDQYISEKDAGIYDALNKGIKIASGDVIGILHSDDFYSDDSVLSDIASAFLDPTVDLLYGDLEYVSKYNEGKMIRYWRSGQFDSKSLNIGWMPPHPSLFIRKSTLDKCGLFNTNYKISSDYDLIIRLFSSNNVNIKYLPRVLIKMRTGGQSNKNIINIIYKMLEDYNIIKINEIGGLLTLFHKNLSKIKQFKVFFRK